MNYWMTTHWPPDVSQDLDENPLDEKSLGIVEQLKNKGIEVR